MNILFVLLIVFLTSCTPISKINQSLPAEITKYVASINTSDSNYYKKKNNPNCCKNTQRIILVGGCFDLLHNAHYDYLRKSRALGDYLIVALEPDETIIKYKKRQPVFDQKDRAKNLSAIRYVDEVLLLPQLKGYKDYLQLVQDVCPDVIAVTAGDPQMENIKKQAKIVGAEVVEVISLIDGISTTRLIRKIKDMK